MLALCHTYYSLQAGVRSPKDWVEAAVQRGYTALAIADVNGLFGAVHLARAAAAAGLQPIVGATLLHGPVECVLLATSDLGYRQLNRILTARHLDPRFDLFAFTPEQTSDLLFLARSGRVLQRLLPIVPRDRLLALPPAAAGVALGSLGLWDRLPVPVMELPVPDAWFLAPADRETFGYLRCLREQAGRRDPISDHHPGILLPPVTAWQQAYPAAAAVSQAVTERCRFAFRFGTPCFPRLHLPAGVLAEAHLQELCRARLRERYTGASQPAAATRLEMELTAICNRGFADYFLFVHEIARFAHSRRIPVEVRGSAASSIVSYLLGFTHCCPLENDLLFERFLNPGRQDCPDIDIDIADCRRDELIAFCYRQWGDDHVAMIATVLTYQTRSAIRDAGRLLGLPAAPVQRLLDDGKPTGHEADLARVASRLMGLPRHLGVHCGGLVITPGPITDLAPLIRAAKGIVMTHYEKDQAEAIGLVKMDLLGNSALSVIQQAQDWLESRGQRLEEPGPRFDFKVNRLLANGDTLGVYQCESPGMRQLCRALKPATVRETAMALSLIRPGPAAAGMKDAFIRRRRGLEPVTYRHPGLATFLGSTYGVMLFQEDVMKVAVNLAGYSLADADALRRAVSKDRGAHLLDQERHRFVFQKAATSGVDPETAADLWQQVSRFASYSYCKAHASVYGRLAWLTARLKAHYPREFYAAILNHHASMYPKRVFVWDAIRHGIPVLPPDLQISEVGWTPTPHGILAGLDCVKGLRQALCRQIVDERRRAPFVSLANLRHRVGFGAGELERLLLVGAGRAWGRREDLLSDLWEHSDAGAQPALLPCRHPLRLPPPVESEFALTDIPFSAHPVSTTGPAATCRAADMGRFLNREVWMTGILDCRKELETHTADPTAPAREMSFLTLEDATGMYEVILFPDEHSRYGPLFRPAGPYRVRGVVTETWDSLSLELREAELA